MIVPNRPSRPRSLSVKKTRVLVLVGLVVMTAMVLSSTNSIAGSLSQRLLASISSSNTSDAKATHVNHSLAAEAAMENTTMSVARRGHTATRLSDGRVLIAGGQNDTGVLNETEIYDPASATFSATR